MPVLIVTRQRGLGEALEQCLVARGLLAMQAESPEAALSLANVLKFNVAVFLGEVNHEAAAAMQEMHTKYGTRGVAVVDDGPASEWEALSGFERSLVSSVSDGKLVQCITELRRRTLDA